MAGDEMDKQVAAAKQEPIEDFPENDGASADNNGRQNKESPQSVGRYQRALLKQEPKDHYMPRDCDTSNNADKNEEKSSATCNLEEHQSASIAQEDENDDVAENSTTRDKYDMSTGITQEEEHNRIEKDITDDNRKMPARKDPPHCNHKDSKDPHPATVRRPPREKKFRVT